MPNNKRSLHDQVDQAHSYHRPEHQETMDTMGEIRSLFAELGHELVESCPISRELSIALHHLDDANMYAIAALERHEPDPDVPGPNTTSHPLPEQVESA